MVSAWPITDTVFLFLKKNDDWHCFSFFKKHCYNGGIILYQSLLYIYIYTWQILLVPGFVSALTLSFNRRFFNLENNGSFFFRRPFYLLELRILPRELPCCLIGSVHYCDLCGSLYWWVIWVNVWLLNPLFRVYVGPISGMSLKAYEMDVVKIVFYDS